MSRLTVTEKEHWKARIERRVDKAIAELEAQDPQLMPTIRAQAEELAHHALGTHEFHAKLESLRSQIKLLEKEHDETERAMLTHALGLDGFKHGDYYANTAFKELHRKRAAWLEAEQLRSSAHGLRILKFREEKDALLDTVWLATSSSQIRDLWSRVSSVLGEEATPLQQQILTSSTES